MPHLSSEDFALSEVDDEVSVSLGRYVYDSHSMVYVWLPDDRKGKDLSVALLSVKRMRELAAWLLDFAERYERDAKEIAERNLLTTQNLRD